MRESTQEKSLVQFNENGIFYKIKRFFKNLFNRNANTTNNYAILKETESLVANKKEEKSCNCGHNDVAGGMDGMY